MYKSNPKKLPIGITSWFDLPEIKDTSEWYKSQKKIIISDCDGILTDSKSACTDTGKLFKTYGAYDKEMIKMMIDHGWEFLFVTADRSGMDITFNRLGHLSNVDESGEMFDYQEATPTQRLQMIRDYKEDGYIVVFVGDSLSDISALSYATYGATTANAPQEVKEYCHYVSNLSGSEGGFADLLLEIHMRMKEMVKI